MFLTDSIATDPERVNEWTTASVFHYLLTEQTHFTLVSESLSDKAGDVRMMLSDFPASPDAAHFPAGS